MTSDNRRFAGILCFPNRESANEGMRLLGELGYHFIELPEGIDPVDERTIFIEVSKPLPAGADERSEAVDLFHEVQSAIAHLGDMSEGGLAGLDEKIDWFK
jgi:hypothetical protein